MGSRRRLLRSLAAALLSAGAWRAAFGATTVIESRAVSGFDTVRWDAIGDLLIEQTDREHLSVEAEPAAKVITEVRQRRLSIGLAPDRTRPRCRSASVSKCDRWRDRIARLG